jgi:hypothetical protein
VNILCVSEEYPWPENTGYRIRLSNTIRALCELGEVDVFIALNDGIERDQRVVPDDVAVARLEVVTERPPKRKVVRLLRWLVGRLPLELLWRRWTRARRRFRQWRRPRYDVVWFSHVDGKVALGDLVTGPAVVDFDNLNDHRLMHRDAARRADGESARARGARPSFAFRFARSSRRPSASSCAASSTGSGSPTRRGRSSRTATRSPPASPRGSRRPDRC